ncbi:helix-turn-helix domain-containing protein [Streptomyces sp. NPDC018693]|uniref:helix-turn-helix domain-containing protein n=1 Tax=unclassified Streptomyces TaxID=2593676 RepID=UPI0037A442B5
MRAEDLPETAAPGDPSPPPGLVVVGHFDRGAGYAVDRPTGSDSWLFIWTTGGQGLLRQGGAGTSAGAGTLVALAPGVAQRYAVAPGARGWRLWWVHGPARPTWTPWLRPYDLGDGLYALGPVPAGLHARIEAAFHRMLDDARRPAPEPAPPVGGDPEPVALAHDTAARELALCALEEALLLATSSVRTPAAPPGVDERIHRAEALITADPGAPHTVRSLAAAVSLSPSRFAHLFTEQLGRSPMRALREARLRHAARLLEATDLPVARVAAASGFSGPFHFTRAFHARYGRPPGAYRNGTRPEIPLSKMDTNTVTVRKDPGE